MREFWVASGHHLTHRRPDGWLAITPELLQAWLARPELAPPEEACAAERALYARLRAAPLAPVSNADLAAIADPDGRENWELFLRLRDTLIAAGSVEAGYIALIRQKIPTAPVLLDQLFQLILRNALDGVDDVQTLRAGENLFRAQQGFLKDGHLHLVDLELADEMARAKAANPLAALFQGGIDSLDVLSNANAWTWWSRSDAHSTVQNFGGDPAARAGLAAVIQALIRHLHRVEATVTAHTRVENADLGWFLGLSREGTQFGNALWHGRHPKEELVGLFAVTFPDSAVVIERMRDRPIWVILAMGADQVLRLKPQNLIDGFPFVSEALV